MIIDHIGQFIPNTPFWFGWVGRISAPIFVYCVVLGFTYTSNIRKYLIRLYLFSLGMAIVNLIINYIFNDSYYYMTNNFLTTLFLVGLIIFIIHKGKVKYYI